MTTPERAQGAKPHLCLASLPLQTSEHLAAVADEATAIGFDVCWLLMELPRALPAATSTLSARSNFRTIETSEQLEKHFSANQPVAIFLQSPYPEHYPEWFWQSGWHDRICFAGYGATLSTWDFGLYGLPTLHDCAWLLAESEFNRRKYVEHGNDGDRVVVAGNPLMYELRASLAELEPQGPRTSRKTVLWAPHWTSSWFGHPRGFSRWREAVVPLLEFAKLHPEITVLARPHPLLLDRFVKLADDESLASDVEEHALRQLLALDTVALSDRTFLDDILRSDALVTDGVSIIAYFAATGKPLAIMRDADSPPFNEVGELLCKMSDLLPDSASLAEWLRVQADGSFADFSASRQELSCQLHPTWADSPVSIWATHAGLVRDGSSS